MTDPHAEARRIAPNLVAAHEVIARLKRENAALSAREERLREALETICEIGETRDVLVARAALSTPEEDDDHARAEHLREAREVEAWQEAKHARREEGR